MKRIVLAGVLAAGVSLMAPVVRADAVTAVWSAGNGAWETPGNWDLGAVPGATTNVRFDASATAPNVSVSSELAPIRSMFVTGKGVSFSLGKDATMTVTEVITNYNSASYSGGAYSFGSDLIVGRSSAWSGNTASYSTAAKFSNGAVADIAGKIWVTGYSGNGLNISGNSFVTCGGYKDAGGTRNKTVIGAGVLHSKGKITIYDCWPDASYPEPFVVDGGTVTNEGDLAVAEGNAGRVPFVLKNGAMWRQYGLATIGNKGNENVLQILSGSSFESSSNVIVAASRGQLDNRVVIDGDSSLSAKNLTLGNANFQTNLCLCVTNGSSVALWGVFDFGRMWGAGKASLVVSDSSVFAANSMSCGYGGSVDELSVVVANSSLTVTNSLSFPYDTSDRRCDLSFVGTAEHPATADFPGGFIIGAGTSRYVDSEKTKIYQRTDPTTLTIDNAIVTGGKAEGENSSGDVRLGALNIAGVSDLSTNRIVIAGAKGCLVTLHRFMAAGSPVFELRVPQGGYQNDYGCALHVKNAYLQNAMFLIDLSAVDHACTWREYLLADSTAPSSGDLNVDTDKITVVAPENCRYEIVSSKRKLAIRVKFFKGLAIMLR